MRREMEENEELFLGVVEELEKKLKEQSFQTKRLRCVFSMLFYRPSPCIWSVFHFVCGTMLTGNTTSVSQILFLRWMVWV